MLSPITLIDGYKLDHRRQYPVGTTHVYANWTPRQSRVPGVDKVVLFGLQYFLKRYLEDEFSRWFMAEEDDVCEAYERRTLGYLGQNDIGSDHIRALHRLGYLPLVFKAVPEGTEVPLRVPMLTVENTHPDFFWLVNYVETLMSAVLWTPCTSATTAVRMRRVLDRAAEATGGPLAFVPWQGHDFSFRGMQGPESAALSGAGHLLSFTGTDTIPSLDLIERYYGDLTDDYLIGGSVAATEHSVMCAGGEEGELDTFRRLLDLYPRGIVSVVSDTWDLWMVLTEYLPALKSQIMARDGKLVIRPDSGDPQAILCGDPSVQEFDPFSPAARGVVQLLWDVFGGTVNAAGYRELDSHIGAIYGDSITVERAQAICANLARNGFASTNVVFGIGSYTYQFVTRDTYGFAMKATWCRINGRDHNIFKKPKTDDGTKNSACGRLAVLERDGVLTLVNTCTPDEEAASVLRTVWRDGAFVAEENFATIRQRLRGQCVDNGEP